MPSAGPSRDAWMTSRERYFLDRDDDDCCYPVVVCGIAGLYCLFLTWIKLNENAPLRFDGMASLGRLFNSDDYW